MNAEWNQWLNRTIEVVQWFIDNSKEKNIDLAIKDKFGKTGFDYLQDLKLKKDLAMSLKNIDNDNQQSDFK